MKESEYMHTYKQEEYIVQFKVNITSTTTLPLFITHILLYSTVDRTALTKQFTSYLLYKPHISGKNGMSIMFT